jgi:hypothetical protein
MNRPMPAYEDYAITCGGRVTTYAVVAGTDLEYAPAARPIGPAESRALGPRSADGRGGGRRALASAAPADVVLS